MSPEFNHQRRRFFGIAAMTIAAAEFGVTGIANAQSPAVSSTAVKAAGHTSFAALKQIKAGMLDIGYAEAGPSDGPVVLLVHGWPYDIYSYVDVATILADAGYRVVIPYLRGYGTTRFLSNETPRNGQQAALAADMIALMDALGVEKAILGGYDWGARTVNIMAALWPERCKAMVSVSGYLIGSQEINKKPLAPKAEPLLVVPVLFRHRARPARLCRQHARVCKADLADGLANVEVRRRDVRSFGCRIR